MTNLKDDLKDREAEEVLKLKKFNKLLNLGFLIPILMYFIGWKIVFALVAIYYLWVGINFNFKVLNKIGRWADED